MTYPHTGLPPPRRRDFTAPHQTCPPTHIATRSDARRTRFIRIRSPHMFPTYVPHMRLAGRPQNVGVPHRWRTRGTSASCIDFSWKSPHACKSPHSERVPSACMRVPSACMHSERVPSAGATRALLLLSCSSSAGRAGRAGRAGSADRPRGAGSTPATALPGRAATALATALLEEQRRRCRLVASWSLRWSTSASPR